MTREEFIERAAIGIAAALVRPPTPGRDSVSMTMAWDDAVCLADIAEEKGHRFMPELFRYDPTLGI